MLAQPALRLFAVERMTSEHFSDRDWEFVDRVRSLLRGSHERSDVATLLEEFSTGPRNGLIAGLHVELAALYGLRPSDSMEWRVRGDLLGASHERLVQLFVDRVGSIARFGRFTMPDPLFEAHRISIEVDGERVAVRELRSKSWDYGIFESVDVPGTYFVEIVLGSHAIYTVVKQLSATDAAIVLGLDEVELDRLVDHYR